VRTPLSIQAKILTDLTHSNVEKFRTELQQMKANKTSYDPLSLMETWVQTELLVIWGAGFLIGEALRTMFFSPNY
jgi:hypothetical protein